MLLASAAALNRNRPGILVEDMFSVFGVEGKVEIARICYSQDETRCREAGFEKVLGGEGEGFL